VTKCLLLSIKKHYKRCLLMSLTARNDIQQLMSVFIQSVTE